MSEPPDITSSFLKGILIFSTTACLTSSSYATYKGYPNVVRYSLLTTLNVGVAGGLFTGIPSSIPNNRNTSRFIIHPQ
jgi:hypothetical protein